MFSHPPGNKEELDLHIQKIKSRLDNLNQLRDANHLAGKAESALDAAEIVCLRHMLFMAITPPTSYLSVTWNKVSSLEQ